MALSSFAQHLNLLHYDAIFIDHVQEFYDYVEIKTLMRLQKPVRAGMRN